MASAKEAATKLLKRYGISPPVNLHKLAEYLKVRIHYKILPANLDGWTVELNTALVKEPRYLMLINSRRLKVRRRFTIAHEIGHIVLGHFEIKSKALCKHRKITEEDNYKYEMEADSFASELLIPTPHLLKLAKEGKNKNINKLCSFYGVSKQAMEIKLEKTERLVKKERAKNYRVSASKTL